VSDTHQTITKKEQKPTLQRTETENGLDNVEQATPTIDGVLLQRTSTPSASLNPNQVLQLQRMVGNQAVGQLLGKSQPTVQRKPMSWEPAPPAKSGPLVQPSQEPVFAKFLQRMEKQGVRSQELGVGSREQDGQGQVMPFIRSQESGVRNSQTRDETLQASRLVQRQDEDEEQLMPKRLDMVQRNKDEEKTTIQPKRLMTHHRLQRKFRLIQRDRYKGYHGSPGHGWMHDIRSGLWSFDDMMASGFGGQHFNQGSHQYGYDNPEQLGMTSQLQHYYGSGYSPMYGMEMGMTARPRHFGRRHFRRGRGPRRSRPPRGRMGMNRRRHRPVRHRPHRGHHGGYGGRGFRSRHSPYRQQHGHGGYYGGYGGRGFGSRYSPHQQYGGYDGGYSSREIAPPKEKQSSDQSSSGGFLSWFNPFALLE